MKNHFQFAINAPSLAAATVLASVFALASAACSSDETSPAAGAGTGGVSSGGSAGSPMGGMTTGGAGVGTGGSSSGSAGTSSTGGVSGSAGSGGAGGNAGAGGGGPKSKMTFFLTSKNPGMGANFGGIEGADAHCQALAVAATVPGGDHTWRAFLSESGPPAINAKDRIGAGPWVNSKGVTVATSVTDLMSENNMLGKANSIDENGATVKGAGDDPNRHDILTGSDLQGNAYPAGGDDHTCEDWTSTGDGAARVGHHDKEGGGMNPMSWLSAHDSNGCTLPNLQATGGDGLIYCFASD